MTAALFNHSSLQRAKALSLVLIALSSIAYADESAMYRLTQVETGIEQLRLSVAERLSETVTAEEPSADTAAAHLANDADELAELRSRISKHVKITWAAPNLSTGSDSLRLNAVRAETQHLSALVATVPASAPQTSAERSTGSPKASAANAPTPVIPQPVGAPAPHDPQGTPAPPASGGAGAPTSPRTPAIPSKPSSPAQPPIPSPQLPATWTACRQTAKDTVYLVVCFLRVSLDGNINGISQAQILEYYSSFIRTVALFLTVLTIVACAVGRRSRDNNGEFSESHTSPLITYGVRTLIAWLGSLLVGAWATNWEAWKESWANGLAGDLEAIDVFAILTDLGHAIVMFLFLALLPLAILNPMKALETFYRWGAVIIGKLFELIIKGILHAGDFAKWLLGEKAKALYTIIKPLFKRT